jgi:hypothetical protein
VQKKIRENGKTFVGYLDKLHQNSLFLILVNSSRHALLCGLGASHLVLTPIAALALHRAIADASASLASLQFILELRLRFGAKMARVKSSDRCNRAHATIVNKLLHAAIIWWRRGRAARCKAAVADRLVERPIRLLTRLRTVVRRLAETALEHGGFCVEAVMACAAHELSAPFQIHRRRIARFRIRTRPDQTNHVFFAAFLSRMQQSQTSLVPDMLVGSKYKQQSHTVRLACSSGTQQCR